MLVVLPSMWFGRRVRRLSRASQDRVADSSAIAAEVLNAIPVVQSYTAEAREAARFDASTDSAFHTAVRRTKARSVLVAFIIIATSAALLWGLYQGTQAVLRGDITAGHLGQTVVYVIILASAAAVLGEVYGDLLRAAGATERLMELLHAQSGDRLAGACRRRRRCRRPAARSRFERVQLPLPFAARTRRPCATSACDVRARRDRGAGRLERRRQEHGVPAAAALLRPAAGPHPARRRAAARPVAATTCARASAWCRRTR